MRPETEVKPPRGFGSLHWAEMWKYRELLYFLTRRDITIRYRQAILGVAWAVLQPVCLMVVFTIIFGELAGLPSDGKPYALFSYAGLLPWQLFSSGVQRSSLSLVGNANLLTKVYFPRAIVPMAAALTPFVDFLIALVVLVGLMIYYDQPATAATLLVVPLSLLTLLTAVAFGIWFSALNVLYRDVQQALPFLLQFWMFVSPVAYGTQIVPEGSWTVVYGLNPMVGIIEGFRWAILGTEPPDALVWLAAGVVGVVLVSGMLFFARIERVFADVV